MFRPDIQKTVKIIISYVMSSRTTHWFFLFICFFVCFLFLTVPDTPPLDIKAETIWTTHTIPLSWTHIPSYLLNGILTGYRITYQAIEIGECPHKENPREVILPPENTSTVLRGLESFALYRIEVTGLTIKGDGPSEVIFAGNRR